jgi:ornithine cyclodeaminase/alanine dehydrogenase-like protein (mu-crystallin family)
LQGLAPLYRLRGSWAQWIVTTTTTTTITILKGNWIRTHNIVVVIKYSTTTTSAKDSIVIRSVDKGEESKYLLGF